MTWNDHWKVDHEKKTVQLLGDSLETRSERMDQILSAEREKGTFQVLKKWTKELFPIYGPGHELILKLERAAAGLFGIVTYGVELIIYREDPDGLKLWAARRSAKKVLYPNALGVTVGGSLPFGESPFECMVRETQEEAGLSESLVRKHAISVGTINYATCSESKTTSGGESGLIRAEVQFLYEMKVGPDVIPAPHNMEASDISLYTIDEIKKALADGEFTPADACFFLDFFIRHGLMTDENEENYTTIVSRLHRPLGMQTA